MSLMLNTDLYRELSDSEKKLLTILKLTKIKLNHSRLQ